MKKNSGRVVAVVMIAVIVAGLLGVGSPVSARPLFSVSNIDTYTSVICSTNGAADTPGKCLVVGAGHLYKYSTVGGMSVLYRFADGLCHDVSGWRVTGTLSEGHSSGSAPVNQVLIEYCGGSTASLWSGAVWTNVPQTVQSITPVSALGVWITIGNGASGGVTGDEDIQWGHVEFTVVDPTPTPTPANTATPTPLTGSVGCVPQTGSSAPATATATLWAETQTAATATRTALPGPGTPWPTRVGPTPSGGAGHATPPKFTFNSSVFGVWAPAAPGGWSPDEGRGGSGALFIGKGSTVGGIELMSSQLVYSSIWYPEWYLTGYYKVVADPNYDTDFRVESGLWIESGGVFGWGSASNDDSRFVANSAESWGEWVPFAVKPSTGSTGAALRLKLQNVQLLEDWDSFYIYFDDFKIMAPGEYGDNLCDDDGNPVPSPTLGVWSTPVVFPTPSDGPGSTGVVIDHLEGVACFGFDDFSIDIWLLGVYAVDGIKVCFDRWEITAVMFGGFDMFWVVVLMMGGVPLLVAIEAFRKSRGG